MTSMFTDMVTHLYPNLNFEINLSSPFIKLCPKGKYPRDPRLFVIYKLRNIFALSREYNLVSLVKKGTDFDLVGAFYGSQPATKSFP